MPRRRKSAQADSALGWLIGAIIVGVIMVPIWLWRQGKAGRWAAAIWVVAVVAGFMYLTNANSQQQVRSTPSISYRSGATSVRSATSTPAPARHTQASAASRAATSTDPQQQTSPTNTLPPATPSASPQVGVANSGANLRAGPGTTFDIVGGIPAGDPVTVVGCDADCEWYLLSTGEWILAQLVTLGGTPVSTEPSVQNVNATAGWGIVNAQTLNVRAGPGTEFQTIATLELGACREIVGGQGEWLQVAYEPDKTGWCSAAYMDLVAACPDAPTAQPTQFFVADPVPTAAGASIPAYVGSPLSPNATISVDTYLHECFGTGNDQELRNVSAGTPVQVVGSGPFVPPPAQQDELGSGPFFKVRLWDGQVAWISASAVDASLDAYPQLSGVCEEYDRLDWSKVVRPTPVPQVYNPPTYNSPAPSGGSSGGSSAGVRSCCRICTTGKACGDSCISRRYTCHKGPGCACNG